MAGYSAVGSALPWGGRGRGFKSRYSDQIKAPVGSNQSELISLIKYRGVAQLGRALGSGPRGRKFESSHSDQKLPNEIHSGVFHMVYYSIIAVVNLSIIQLPLAVLFF